MKNMDTNTEILNEEFENIGIIEEPRLKPLTIGRLNSIVNYAPTTQLPVKKFNKEEIQVLEAQMKKEGKL